MRRARKLAALFGAYLVGYHLGRYDAHVAAWRTDPTGARRVG